MNSSVLNTGQLAEPNSKQQLFMAWRMQALQRLTEAAEKAKMELSSVAQTSISLPFITATADGPKHIESQMSRAKFESICSDLLDRCRIPVEQALKDAKLKLSDLNEVSLCRTQSSSLSLALLGRQ